MKIDRNSNQLVLLIIEAKQKKRLKVDKLEVKMNKTPNSQERSRGF